MDVETLSIGDFSRATQLSVKKLRHYHQIGLLEPADIDRHTGYRSYTVDQIPVAQVIKRFRDVEMPLDQILRVLNAPDLSTRNDLVAAHLAQLKVDLARVQSAVTSLARLLEGTTSEGTFDIGHRHVQATDAAAISEIIGIEDAQAWYRGALGELYATVAAQGLDIAGSAGGIFGDELFAQERGRATMFLPFAGTLRPVGRVTSLRVPAVELATKVHVGSHASIDRSYGDLGAYVARHALAVDGPIREYYEVWSNDTSDETLWRTEIGWPIFRVVGAQ
jgi:DNA-binding transcriptional MerR regulator